MITKNSHINFLAMKSYLCLSILLLTCSLSSIAQDYEIYVSDISNFNPPFQVLKYDSNGSNGEVFAGASEEVSWPQDIVFLEGQNIALISNFNGFNPQTGYISKHDIETGEFIDFFATAIGSPTRMRIGADSLLYVLQWHGSGKVLRYELDGTFVGEFTEVGVSESIGMDWDNAGNLYVSSFGEKKVHKFGTNGEDLGVFTSSNLSGPTDIRFNEVGALMVVDWQAGNVKKFTSDGIYDGIFIPGLARPEGVALLPDGNILIGNGGQSTNTGSIKMYTPEGQHIEDIIEAGDGGLDMPNAVVIRDLATVAVSNPTHDDKFVQPTLGRQFEINLHDKYHLRVVNNYGQVVFETFAQDTFIWNVNNIPDGLYYIIAQTKKRGWVQKIIVVN